MVKYSLETKSKAVNDVFEPGMSASAIAKSLHMNISGKLTRGYSKSKGI